MINLKSGGAKGIMEALKRIKQLIGEICWRKKERHYQRQELMKALIREQMECCRKDHQGAAQDSDVCPGGNHSFQQHKQLFLKKHQDFRRYHRYLQRLRPLILLFYLVSWYILFRYLGGENDCGCFRDLNWRQRNL